MKTKKMVLVYKSKYGSTKKYIEWLKEELQCDVFDRDRINIKKLREYDTIVYGGGIYASAIKGFDIISKNGAALTGKDIIVLGVGCSLGNDLEIEKIKEYNFRGNLNKCIKFFYLRGGFDFENLNFFDKTAMKMMRNSLVNKDGALTEEERFLLSCYEKSHDWTNRSNILPIIEYINEK